MLLRDRGGNRWCFIHNPKTGGASVTGALSSVGSKDSNWISHEPASRVDEFAFKFAFVRNPWDRMASYYAFMADPNNRTRNMQWYDIDRVAAMGFKRWLLDEQTLVLYERELHRERPPVQRRPQTWWVDGCHFVGRYEKLQEDFDRACQVIGAPPARLKHVNARTRKPYQEVYDDEMRAAVAEWFKVDVERWGYEFGC